MDETDTEVEPGIFHRRHRLVTFGILAIMFLIAFENLAVTTIMPVVSRELDGSSLYAVAFAGPLAVGVVGMVIAGIWCDRSGPRGPLFASVAVFAIGLVIAGTAPTMPLLVTGRIVYGLAGGATGVALYVIIARVYVERDQSRMFGALAAAWVFPALVGPAIAGIVADTVGWRWVFLGVIVLVLASVALVVPAMRRFQAPSDRGAPWSIARIVWSIVLATAVLGLSLSGELPDWWSIGVAVLALLVAVVAARPLLPAGSLRSRRGLPSVIAMRAVIAAAYFGAEVYVPYLLTTQFGLSPSLAGLSLTGGGVFWGVASVLQGRVSNRLAPGAALRIGIAGVVIAILAALGVALLGMPVWIAIAGWAVGGFGMGTLIPRLSVLMFSYSNPGNQGFNSAAMSIADGVGPGISLAIAGILFGSIAGGGTMPFAAVFLLVLVIALAALFVSGRTVAHSGDVAHARSGNPVP